MANATEVARARDRIVYERPTSATGEERALAGADGGTAYETAGDVESFVTELLAASVDKWIYVSRGNSRVLGFREVHSVIGGSGAVVTPRKVTAAGTAAPGDAAGATVKELTTAAIGLETTINVTQTPTNTATAADLLLADGDKIGLNFAGTLTGLVGSLTVYVQRMP